MARWRYWRLKEVRFLGIPASTLEMDFGMTMGFPSISAVRQMKGVHTGNCRAEALSYPVGKLLCRVATREEGMTAEELHESLWHDFFAHPSKWWDHRRRKLTTRSPDFRHKISKVPLWLNSRHRPAWVDSQLAALDARMTTPPQSVSSSIEGQGGIERLGGHDGPLDIGMCRKLCEDGRISEAVDTLKILVQQGCHVSKNIFYCVLKSCIAHKNLVMGRRIHALTTESGYAGDAFLATHLIGLYASHGMLEEAMQVFRKVCTPTTYNWATIIFAYARRGNAAEAIRLYRLMLDSTTIKPDNRLYVAVLKACATAGDLVAGKEVHSHILASPEKPDRFVQAALVSMYAKCGSLGDARRVFDRFPQKDVVAWTAMLAGYMHQGMGQEALSLYSNMQQEGITTPDSVTFVRLLQACASVGVGAMDHGKLIHAQIKEQGLEQDVVVGGSLVNMYAKLGNLVDARRVFNILLEKDVVAWTAMLAGYAHQGMGQEALCLYNSMQQEGITTPDSVTFLCLLQACASVGVGALNQGKLIHAQIKEQGLEQDVVLGGSLVYMYAKCGSLQDAQMLFHRLPKRNVVAWTAMLAGYAQQGMGLEALHLYSSMQREGSTTPDPVTFVCLLQACASVGVGALEQGKQLHSQIKAQGLEDDVVLGTSLVNMYSKCDSLEGARQVFDRLPERNVVAWNAMLAGYAQQGMGNHALDLYSTMQEEGITVPDSVTFVCLLQACASIGEGALYQGKLIDAQIKEQGMEDNVVVGGSLVNMYAKCGSLGDARQVFDRLPERDVVAWTAMLAGFAREGMGQEALHLYSRMQQEGIATPDSATFVCLLQACAFVAALPLGKQVHAEIMEQGLQADVAVRGGLVNMYAKCGSMFDAQQVFDLLPDRSIEAWNALTNGYARQGDREMVFDLIDRMRLEGIKPDGITLLSVLTVCSHAGEVDKGRKYFEAMRLDYGISPSIEHYTCMVDLLGRAGHLDEALHLAKTMPFPADSVVWFTLLGACQKWKNVEIGEQAFQCAMSLDREDASSYVLMSNLYASSQMWEEAQNMHRRRTKLGALKKTPGQSWWTDMGGVVHTFVVGDKKHPESEGIYAKLEQLDPEMSKA